jgi:hypothetical protein
MWQGQGLGVADSCVAATKASRLEGGATKKQDAAWKEALQKSRMPAGRRRYEMCEAQIDFSMWQGQGLGVADSCVVTTKASRLEGGATKSRMPPGRRRYKMRYEEP